MSARKFLRVELVATTLSHLVCAGCGGYRCDFAFAVNGDDEPEPQAGVHKKCISLVKAKRGAR